MQFLNNLKVAYKLIIIGVAAFFATVFIGMIGYFALQEAGAELESMYRKNAMSLYYVGRIRYNLRYSQIQASLQPYTIAPDRKQDRITKFDTAIKEADEAMADYEKIVKDDPDLFAKLEKARKEFPEYKNNATKLMNMTAYGEGVDERAPMNYYQDHVMPHSVAVNALLADIQQESMDDAEKAMIRSEE
ncbi:MAG: MCP four helix bundle domain-containing protein, partial [Selenomonadaceae bacterium]|nr:MCP four helix bundle domain-containing protein [Selenomonadaceae bacterium]